MRAQGFRVYFSRTLLNLICSNFQNVNDLKDALKNRKQRPTLCYAFLRTFASSRSVFASSPTLYNLLVRRRHHHHLVRLFFLTFVLRHRCVQAHSALYYLGNRNASLLPCWVVLLLVVVVVPLSRLSHSYYANV